MDSKKFKKSITAVFIILGGIISLFLFHLIKNKIEYYQSTSQRQSGKKVIDLTKLKREKVFSLPHGFLHEEESRKKNSTFTPKNLLESDLKFPRKGKIGYQRFDKGAHSSDLYGLMEDDPSDQSGINLNEIASYDPLQDRYLIKKINLFTAKEEDLTRDLLSALKVLNKKDMPSDYFRCREYEAAYDEINKFYSDIYIWPYFTNHEAKINFFLFLFTRYAADNKKWRTYEKDVSDCSQFSQRIYLFLYPGEVYMEDGKYFYFLFSDMKTREERKKLCNKIPDIFYTLIDPYILKKDLDELLSGHAMISFAPDHNLEGLILAEPQAGSFEKMGRDVYTILDNEYDKYSLLCRLGKIVSIAGDQKHEARIKEEGVYFIPAFLPEKSSYQHEDFRSSYGDRPILLETNTYHLCKFISSYLKEVLHYQIPDQFGFLQSLENVVMYEKNSFNQLETDLKSSVDIVMHGLIDLDPEDLQQIKDELEDLKDVVSEQPGLSPQVSELVNQIYYLFLLKLKPLLD